MCHLAFLSFFFYDGDRLADKLPPFPLRGRQASHAARTRPSGVCPCRGTDNTRSAMAPPEKPAIQSSRNPSATVSLYECSRPTIPRMQPSDIYQKYITLVVFVVGGCGGDSEFCPALLKTAVLRVPTRYSSSVQLCSVCLQAKKYSSVRCASAANI